MTAATTQCPDPRASCQGKEPFLSPRLAIRVARKSKYKSGTYKCKHCGFWHVGKAILGKPA